MGETSPDTTPEIGQRRRRLRAVFAADVANFGSLVSVDETNTLDALWNTRRIATQELAASGGWLFGMPGDGLFAIFESAVDAVRCALRTQSRLRMPGAKTLRLRIGVHLGEVLFQDNLPFGEALVIAARLESLARPGGVLVSSTVKEAVEARISAEFGDYSVRELKHIPRPIGTFCVSECSKSNSEVTTALVLNGSGPNQRWETSNGNEMAGAAASAAAAAKQVALPKVTSLVLPAAPSMPVSSDPVQTDAIAATRLAELAQALMTHIGPLARVLVRRHAAENPDAAALIAALSEEIPAEAERREFVVSARNILNRPIA
jgi:class 3 adenylate cyclase